MTHQVAAHTKFNEAYAQYWDDVIDFYNYEQFNEGDLKRRFALIAKPGTSALSIEDQTQVSGREIDSLNPLRPSGSYKQCYSYESTIIVPALMG